MILKEFVKLLRSVSCEHIYLQVYYKCPCCGRDVDLINFDLQEDFTYSCFDSKIVNVWFHEDNIDVEVKSDKKGV